MSLLREITELLRKYEDARDKGDISAALHWKLKLEDKQVVRR